MGDFANYAPALPEIFLAVAAMMFLMYGVFRGESSARTVSWLAVLGLIVTGIIVVVQAPDEPVKIFANMFVVDDFNLFFKTFILAATALAVIMSMSYAEREDMARFEFPVLMMLAALGMIMMVSANDLISLYVGLELQSLSLYVVAAIRRDSIKASEAGLKYFVLGALASGMLLYGASMIYGFTGTTNFDTLKTTLAGLEMDSSGIGAIVGVVFVMVGLAFKVSAVPFHMWTPDVYEGAPTPVTAFFAAAPKLAAFGLLIRVMVEPFEGMAAQWQQVIILISAASMILGAFAAIAQSNIKRLLAYSSIGHVGYALIGLAAAGGADTPASGQDGIEGVLIYMVIYMVMTIGTFACVLAMRREGRMLEEIRDLSGLSKTNPAMAAFLAIFMFSMAGIPPLAGFFGKLYVFLAAIEQGLVILAVIGVLSSVVAAYYYLKIVKVMYFDDPVDALDKDIGADLKLIRTVAAALVLLFVLFPNPLIRFAEQAVRSVIS